MRRKSFEKKILDLHSPNGKVCIPVHQIIGICEPGKASKSAGYNTFIATGADSPDGGENGFYVSNEYDVVRSMLEREFSA